MSGDSPAPTAPTANVAARIEEGLAEAARLLPPQTGAPRLRVWALRDPTNLLCFGVAFAAGVGAGPWWLAVAAVLAEGGWLLAAPWIPASRRALLARDARDRGERERARRTTVLGGLRSGDRARLEALLELRQSLGARAAAALGDAELAALSRFDVLLGLCALEARRAADLEEYLRELDPEQVERDRHRLERQAGGDAPAGDLAAGLELVRQRQARVRGARAGLEASRARIAELEGAARAAASPPGEGAPPPALADVLAGVEAVVAATQSDVPAGSWRALMQRTPAP